ncbi:MAG: hypothetical protein HC881_20530 [Leptolyngbyaceae cyanobacterium SL_7_1]|nr:hypothetical protein [Leptolyngbyaceae cyanobacterium SL_7_1]
MQYSLTYKPSKTRSKHWLLKIWEPAAKPNAFDPAAAPYLYKVQYWLNSKDEAEVVLMEHFSQYGVRPIGVFAA